MGLINSRMIALIILVIIIIAGYFWLTGGGGAGATGDIVRQYVYATAELDLAEVQPLVTEDVYDRIKDDIELLQISGVQIQVTSFSITNEEVTDNTATVSYSVTMSTTAPDEITGSETTETTNDLTISLTKVDGVWKISSIPS